MKPFYAIVYAGVFAVLSSACGRTGASSATSAAADGGMDGMSMGADLTSEPIAPVNVDAVYIVNGGASSISVVDAKQSTVVGTIMLKNVQYPHHVSLGPDRSQLVVAVPGMDFSAGHNGGMDGMRGVVMVLEATTGKTLAARKLDAMNHNAIHSPDGKEIWTAQMTMGGSVLVLDAKTLATLSTIGVGDMPAEVTFSKDGKYGFVANGMSNNVSVIDPASKKVIKTIDVGKDPVGAWAGDDGVMYVDCEQGKVVTAIDSKSLTSVRTYNLGYTPGMARTTPDGSSLWITNADDGLVTINMTSADMKMAQVAAGRGAHGIVFSNDGTRAYVTNQLADSLTVIDVAAQKALATIPLASKPNGLVFRAK